MVPVLRFGSAGNTIIFTGPIKDIGLKTISLPENDVVKTKNDAYHITGTMYLTKSGLIVNIGEDFASKFDGSVYTSTKLIASKLGKLAVEKNLTGVNENGETIYVDKGRPEHIWANSLDMDVLGNIGTAKKPLLIHVPGKVVISTEYGSAYVRNLYQPETAEVAEKYGFGRIVSDADFRFVPYAFMTLRPVEPHDSILTLKEVGGSRMVAIRGSGLDAVQGNVLYIWALDEDGVSVTNELRHLHLNAGTVRMMIALGYEWLMFQTGDSVVMIHLTELENGSYIITVDPQNADCTVSVSLDGEERNQLPDAMLVAEITDVPATV